MHIHIFIILSSRELDAFFAEHAFVLPHTKQFGCTITAHHTPIPSAQYGAVVAKDSPLKNLLSEAILDLLDQGVLKDLKSKWFWNACEASGTGTNTSKFNPIFFSSLFAILVGAMFLSFVILTCEEIWNRKICENTRSVYEQVKLISITKKESITGRQQVYEMDYDKRLRHDVVTHLAIDPANV